MAKRFVTAVMMPYRAGVSAANIRVAQNRFGMKAYAYAIARSTRLHSGMGKEYREYSQSPIQRQIHA